MIDVKTWKVGWRTMRPGSPGQSRRVDVGSSGAAGRRAAGNLDGHRVDTEAGRAALIWTGERIQGTTVRRATDPATI